MASSFTVTFPSIKALPNFDTTASALIAPAVKASTSNATFTNSADKNLAFSGSLAPNCVANAIISSLSTAIA